MLALFLAMKSMNNISSLHECDTSLADTGKRIAVKKKKKMAYPSLGSNEPSSYVYILMHLLEDLEERRFLVLPI